MLARIIAYSKKQGIINSSQVCLLLVIKVCVDMSFSDTSLAWIACQRNVNLTTTTTFCAKLILLRYKQNSFCNLSNIWVVNRNKMTPWELELIKEGIFGHAMVMHLYRITNKILGRKTMLGTQTSIEKYYQNTISNFGSV